MTMKGDYINKLRKRSVRFVFWLLLAFCCLLLGACMFLQQAKFGKLPHGENLAQVERSAHYRDGQFYNLIDTPKFSQDVSVVSIVWNDLIHPAQRLVPEHPFVTGPALFRTRTTSEPDSMGQFCVNEC